MLTQSTKLSRMHSLTPVRSMITAPLVRRSWVQLPPRSLHMSTASSSLHSSACSSYRCCQQLRASSSLLSSSSTSYSRLASPPIPVSMSSSHRSFTTAPALHHPSTAEPDGEPVTVTFINPDGSRVTCTGPTGENLLALAHQNGVELEGACEGSVACSTCHCILPEEQFSKLEPASDEENDMLDLAFGLTDTSRLGCQVKLSPELEGMEIQLPAATRNMAVDGHKPKPH